jgi:transcription elongation factor GreA
MESLIANARSATGWDEALVQEVLDTVGAAHREGTLPELSSAIDDAVDKNPTPQLRFVQVLSAALEGSDPAAVERLASLLEHLNQQGEWVALGRLSIGIADLSGDAEFCRYVARAAEQGGVDILPRGTLDRALELAPDNHRLTWQKAFRLEAEGDIAAARGLFAASVAGWARAKNIERVEEAILRLVDHPDHDHWTMAWEGIAYLARHDEPKPLNAFLEMGMDKLSEADLVEPVWASLRALIKGGHSTRKIHGFAGTLARKAHASLASIDQVLERSGLGSPDANPQKALAEFDRLLKFAPDLFVEHQSFGVGTIRDNDGETVVIDFPEKAGHRMSLTIAERSLDILSPDDIRTTILRSPDEVKAMAKNDPTGLLARALEKLGGQGSSADVRKILVPEVMTSASWPAWWKKATERAKDDVRIDTSQTFRRVYRVAEHGESLLPPIQERSDLHANVEMIHRFLSQHPEQKGEAVRVYRPRLATWLGSTQKLEPRLHLLNVLRLWDPDREPAFLDAMRELLADGGDFAFTSLPTEQLDLLEAAAANGMATPGAMAALATKTPEVRTRAAEILRTSLGGELIRYLRDLYSRSPEGANRILGVVEFGVDNPEALPEAVQDPWFATRAVITIVQSPPKEPLRKWAQSLLRVDGALCALDRATPLDEEGGLLLETLLIGWRASDRYLFPILDFLSAAGGESVVEAVQRYRSEKSAEFVSRAKAATEADSGILMTRVGLERLRDEIHEVETALKTTLPESIRKAMEHGDLKENAEYHAAKDKQRQYSQRVTRLHDLISQARAIEDAPPAGNVVAPGTEVLTRDLDDGTEHRYWILGDGDSFLGPDVISYRAPLGAALRGARVGDEVKVPLEGGTRSLRVLEVVPKLPSTSKQT